MHHAGDNGGTTCGDAKYFESSGASIFLYITNMLYLLTAKCRLEIVSVRFSL